MYYLDQPVEESNVSYILTNLLDHYELFGLKSVVDTFFYKLGIANSNYAANLVAIDALIDEAFDDYHKAYSLLDSGFNDRYSIEFQKGSGGKIVVMTAHASKGLEFDHVFMGGLSTNGFRMPDKNLIGKEPGSFRWRVDHSRKDLIDTPQFYLEKEIAKAKDFAESKRLFYVVGTRAEKAISWVDLTTKNPKETKSQGAGNSWINGVRAFEMTVAQGCEQNRLDLFEHIKRNLIKINLEFPFEKEVSSAGAPLFHLDHIGVENCNHHSDQEQLLVLSELSVTALTALSSCPKRFYLKNILKIDPVGLDDILDLDEDELTDEYKQVKEGASYEQEVVALLPVGSLVEHNTLVKQSAAQRGTRIHDCIYQIIESGFEFDSIIDSLPTSDQRQVRWAGKLAQQESELGKNLIAEVEVKFDFFGMKISGIPDLVIIDDKNKKIEVWDYKTGRRDEKKDAVYSTQLRYYAYGLAKLDQNRRNYNLSASLLYVDSQQKVDFAFSYDQLKEFLFQEFSKMNQLTQENRENCQFCMFRQLCPTLSNL
jgi:ATP-dependent exoDNAse (exonuclease V) beta subunit